MHLVLFKYYHYNRKFVSIVDNVIVLQLSSAPQIESGRVLLMKTYRPIDNDSSLLCVNTLTCL